MSEANPIKILVLNAGSSSLKFQLIETSARQIEQHSDRLLARGSIEKIGTGEAILTHEMEGRSTTRSIHELHSHKEAVKTALATMTGSGGVLEKPEQIAGVGHRVVHGGEHFAESLVMDEPTVQRIEEAIELAPLHNPHNLKGYYAARAQLPESRHVAVFDTSFHQTLPAKAYLYGLPYMLYERHKVRRYGFHGTSHRYVSERFAQLSGRPASELKLITCHLGNGCSVCAIDGGRSVDTSMGFTPLEGLVMGTRSGDVDPAAVLHIMAVEELSFHEVSSLLNKHSGLYGLSGISNDMRTLIERSREGDQRAKLAIDVFCHRVKKYVSAYYGLLNGATAVIFTGGIGENAVPIRSQICESLDSLGIVLDDEKNEAASGVEMEISAKKGATAVWVIPTNEELMIARDTYRCIQAHTKG